jgi:steroid delta-isomerase-like uncharacterized protein
MSQQDNLRVAREIMRIWSAHDLDNYAKLLDEKYVAESDTIPAPVQGRAGAREFMKVYVTAFPDLRLDTEQMLASEDFVVTRWRATGTHNGPLMSIPPTNRKVVTHGCTVSQYRNGRPAHDWIYWDTGNLMRQLGVLPSP